MQEIEVDLRHICLVFPVDEVVGGSIGIVNLHHDKIVSYNIVFLICQNIEILLVREHVHNISNAFLIIDVELPLRLHVDEKDVCFRCYDAFGLVCIEYAKVWRIDEVVLQSIYRLFTVFIERVLELCNLSGLKEEELLVVLVVEEEKEFALQLAARLGLVEPAEASGRG